MIDINTMTWSYSRLKSFHTCKYAWYLQYVKKTKQIQNAFAQFGLFGHKLIDEWARGLLKENELAREYIQRYDKSVTIRFPRMSKFTNLTTLYYNRGLEYFENFHGFGQKEIVSSERTYIFQYEGLKCKAIVDLLVRNDEDKLILIDHKSYGTSKTQVEIREEAKQLYWYSIPVWQKYKELPESINFNLYARGDWYQEPFDKKRGSNARQWISKTLDDISKETEFPPNKDEMFCKNICGYRNICKYCK